MTLLRGLPLESWELPTVAQAWAVRDIIAHLLDTTLRRLSFHRDGMTPPPPPRAITSERDFVAFINTLNAQWVTSANHQQQIRMAVGAASLADRRYLGAVIDIAVRGLPHAFRDVCLPNPAVQWQSTSTARAAADGHCNVRSIAGACGAACHQQRRRLCD